MRDTLDILHALFVTPRNITIVVMAWALVVMVGKIIPDAWAKSYRKHWVPLLELVVCSSAVWVSGLRPGFPEGVEVEGLDGNEIGWRVALGIILAMAAYVLPIVVAWAASKWLPPKVVTSIKRALL